MIKSCRKRLALLANLTGKGNLLVLTLLLVVLSSVILAYQAIYTREQANAAPNTNINFQARILTNSGALVSDGNYSIQFKIYDTVAGPTSQWNETQVVSVKNGYVSVSLGSVNPLSGIDWSQEQWLTMNINGDGEMAPRMKVTAVPFALRSNQADTLTDGSGTISASNLVQLAPGSVQSINSINSVLRVAQLGAGGLLQLQNTGGDKFVVANNGDTNIGGSLTVSSGITVGNSTSTTAGTIRWTGSVFEGYNGYAWAPLGSSGGAGSLVNIVKPSNEVVNNSASLQDDDHLTFPIGANEEYTFRFVVQANSATTPDLRFAVSAPVGATCRVGYADFEGATSNGQYGCGVSTASVPGNGAVDLYEITGSVTNGATPGSITLRWAQFVANASNTTVYAGSYVQAIRSIGAGSAGQVFVQNGNSFGTDAILGTNDNNNLSFITNGAARLTVLANGNVGIGDSTPNSLLTVGTADAFQVNTSGDVSTNGTLTVNGLSTLNNSLVAGASATGTVSTTEPISKINVTNVITTTAVFANNDIIFINNAGQDYYTRVVSGGGGTNLVVSPAVSYDASATVTKYQVQNIGATATDYATQGNRFFQGYFLGGVVIGAGSTTISDGNIDSTTTLYLQQNGGALEVGGTLNVAGTITGNGSGLTNIDGSQISSGSVQDSSLSANVTLAGNTFNGVSQLLQLNGSGKVDDSLLSTNITAQGNSFNGVSQLVQLNGTGQLPALNASNLTSLNASNISSGTLDSARLGTNVTVAGNSFNGASQLVQLNGSGALPALSGANLTNLNASNISSGTLDTARLSATVTLAGNTFNGASQLLQLNGSGKVDDSLLSTNITALGNTFNGTNQLVQLNGLGYLPALNASNLTSINASNISSGTLDDARLSTNVTVAGNSFNGASQLVQLNGSGALPALSGANLTSLNGSNISSGTLDTARLSTTVTLAGNTFNGASQLVQLNGSGALPALSGANLTSLNGSNISSGTLDTARLSTTVTLAGNTFNGASQLVQLNSSGEIPALSGVNITNMNASNLSSGTIGDSRLSSNVCLINSDTCGYIRLASGTAQTDSTTNSSIYINKTGATGDIITLSDAGTNVFRVANDGSLEIRQTSSTALAIKNAGGTDFFGVDTSGAIVRIGSSIDDGTGTLLVLDSKNTAGDPTGVNGGSYYNSVDGKNRCFENGDWVDCITTKLAGETTLGAAANTISVSLNDNYEYLECRVDIVGRTAASIPYLRFNNNTGAASYTWNTYGIVAAATTDWQDSSDSEIQISGTQTGTNIISADMKITNLNGSNKVVDWTSAGVEAVGTNSNRYSGVGGFYSTAQVTSIQIVASTGNFAAGSHAWCQGKNVR